MAIGPDELVILLTRGISQRKMYFAGHPKVVAYSQEFPRLLTRFLSDAGRDSFFLGVVDGKLVYNGRYLVGPNIVGSKLVAFAEFLHCGGFTFPRSIEPAEMIALFTLAAQLPDPPDTLDEARALLTAGGVRSIEISPPYADPEIAARSLQDEGAAAWTGEANKPSGNSVFLGRALFDCVDGAHNCAALDRNLDIDRARAVSEQMITGTEAGFAEIMRLVQYPDFDTYTVGHSVRVSLLSVLVGRSLGLDQRALLELGMAGLLHDVGKGKIPDEILFKPGRLDDDELKVMRTHARLGAEILMEREEAGPLAVAAAWGHHLRHDGGGYPPPPAWAKRNFITSLLQVCDVYEALTAIRPYKPPLVPRRVYEIMVADRGAFDPTAFHLFVRAMGLYPPGSQVLLSDGSAGVVREATADPERPKVTLIQHRDGGLLEKDERPTVNLAAAELEIAELVLG